MKTLVYVLLAGLFCHASALADDWSPTPMVIDVQDIVQYDFDGTEAEIPFNLSGHNAKIWLVIETRLSDAEKPVAIQNGFKGWHYVNLIDTTIYVSTARNYDVGTNLVFPWDGTGNESQYEDHVTTGQVPPGYYRYYLWGYDDESDRELACDFLPIGNYWEGQYLKFYPLDETGAPYEAPMLMGQVPAFLTHEALGYPIPDKIRNATIVKWKLGNDPMNPQLLETSSVTGFSEQVITHCKPATEAQAPWYGAGVFDSRNHEVFYFTGNSMYYNEQTVFKYQYVANGEAIEDTDEYGFDNIIWYDPAEGRSDAIHSVLHTLSDDELVMLDGASNSIPGYRDRLHVFGIDDPTDEYFDMELTEFYMPNQPLNPSDGEARTVSQLNRLVPAKREGEVFITGDYSCLTECIDISRLLHNFGDLDPYSGDGSGYVVWANSNGDFFFDMSPYPNPDAPEQLWACNVSEPHNAMNPRRDLSSADMNGFLVAFSEFTGTNSIGMYCPDGTGIAMGSIGPQYFTGYDGQIRNGGGEILDYNSQYDGLYVPPQPIVGEEPYHAQYTKTTWVAFDSDSGLLGYFADDFGPHSGQEQPDVVKTPPNHSRSPRTARIRSIHRRPLLSRCPRPDR